MKSIFVTATGTDTGKTYVSALIIKTLRAAGLNAGYYKAATSGGERLDDGSVRNDATYVAEIAGLPETPLVSYVYETAVSPHLAARLEGRPPELGVIRNDFQKLGTKHDYVVMEGSGGIVCPLRYDDKVMMLADVIQALGMGVLVVSGCALGSINAAVLTVEYLSGRKIPIKGIVFNRYHGGIMEDDNIEMIKSLTGAPVCAVVFENQQTLDADSLAPLFV